MLSLSHLRIGFQKLWIFRKALRKILLVKREVFLSNHSFHMQRGRWYRFLCCLHLVSIIEIVNVNDVRGVTTLMTLMMSTGDGSLLPGDLSEVSEKVEMCVYHKFLMRQVWIWS